MENRPQQNHGGKNTAYPEVLLDLYPQAANLTMVLSLILLYLDKALFRFFPFGRLVLLIDQTHQSI